MKVLLVLAFFAIFILIFFAFQKRKKNNIIFLLPFFSCLNFQVPFSDTEYFMVGNWSKFAIGSTTLLLVVFFMCFNSSRKIKVDSYYFFILFLLLVPIYQISSTSLIIDLPRFVEFYSVLLSIFLCFSISLYISRDLIVVDKLFYLFNFTAIYSGVISILQIITKKTLSFNHWNGSILYTEGIVDSYRAIGIAGSNNSAGNLGAILFIICLFNYYKNKDKLSFISCAFSIVAVALTQTRVAMLAILIVLLSLFFLKTIKCNFKINKRLIFSLVFYVFFSFFLVFIAFIFGEKIYEILFLNRGNTESSRVIQFMSAIENGFSEFPFLGVGLGQWRAYMYYIYDEVDLYIHSQYLSILVEQGFFSFIMFVIINFGILFAVFRNPYLGSHYKLLAYSLFIANFISSNANPNQMYLLNNIFYYIVLFSIYSYGKHNSCKIR